MQASLSYLKKLKKNNNRDWFLSNKEEFMFARDEFEKFIQSVISHLDKFDPDIKDLDVKKSIFRIYRDVRFSKDKTPYKTNFAASLQKNGRKSGLAGYYIHIEPGSSFVGGGIWKPDPETTAKIRQEIDYNPKEFLSIINNKNFKSHFGGLYTKDLSLKRIPKGYEAGNPMEEYLKLHSWLAEAEYGDKELTAPDFLKKVVSNLKALKPFIDFLNIPFN